MTNKNKKTPSLVGNIISIYFLFFLASRFFNIQSFSFSKITILILILFIIIGLGFLGLKKNLFKNKFDSNDFSIRGESEKGIKESTSSEAKYMARNKIMREKTDITERFKNLDKNNHYVKQYKELYESGIMTKEELNDRLAKLTKKL